MGKVELVEFVPPIVVRAIKFFEKKLLTINRKRKHEPFGFFPNDLKVKWIMDVGANVGDVAEAGLKSYPDSKIICFEPVKDTFSILSNRLSGYSSRTHLYNLALSNVEEECEINITSSHGANSIMPQAKIHKDLNPNVREIGKEIIHLVKLDDFCKQLPSQKIDILKIDVEGHELNVLKGGENFIKNNVEVVLIEISFMRDTSIEEQSIFKIFSFFEEMEFSLINIIDLHHVEESPVQIVQMDCVFRNRRFLK